MPDATVRAITEEEMSAALMAAGHCHCGCGQETLLSTRTDPRHGSVKGQPLRYLRGHQFRINLEDPEKKACKTCKLVKPLDEFNINQGCLGGRRTECKECEKERYRRGAVKIHGLSGYSKGCKCEICAVAHTQHWKAYSDARRKRIAAELKAHRRETAPAFERWLDLPGYEGFYEISDHARLWSIPRFNVRGGLVKTTREPKGYATATLSKEGVTTRRRIHQLVALAFIGPCPDGQEVRHGPGGRGDNRAVNLSYGTSQDNSNDMIRDDTVRYGETCPVSKLTWAAVTEIRTRRIGGESQVTLAREFGMSRSSIRRIVNGEQWRSR